MAHALVDLRPDCALGDAQVIVRLQSEPQLGRHAEILAQSQGGVNNFGIIGIAMLPDKAEPLLVIDTDAGGSPTYRSL